MRKWRHKGAAALVSAALALTGLAACTSKPTPPPPPNVSTAPASLPPTLSFADKNFCPANFGRGPNAQTNLQICQAWQVFVDARTKVYQTLGNNNDPQNIRDKDLALELLRKSANTDPQADINPANANATKDTAAYRRVTGDVQGNNNHNNQWSGLAAGQVHVVHKVFVGTADTPLAITFLNGPNDTEAQFHVNENWLVCKRDTDGQCGGNPVVLYQDPRQNNQSNRLGVAFNNVYVMTKVNGRPHNPWVTSLISD